MDGTGRIDELEQKFAENPRRYFAPLANEYRKAGNPRRAIEICRAHLGQLPGHMSGQVVYGQALFECGEYGQAREIFEQALAMDRENLIVLRHLGDLALREGDTAGATQWYSRVLEVDPKDTSVTSLVNELQQAGETRAAGTAGIASSEAATAVGSDVSESPAPGVIPEEAPITDAVAAAEPLEVANATDLTEAREAPAGDAAAVMKVPPSDAPGSDHTPAHTSAEDETMAEELGFPLAPPQAFVTETMAELYLGQGFTDLALETYRQLAELKPQDEQIRARLAELESTEAGKELISSRREALPVASPPPEEDESKSPSMESSGALEETPAGGSETVDSPASSEPSSVGELVESPSCELPPAEPREIAAAQITVREFFALLGARRPRSNGSSGRSPEELSVAEAADRIAATALAGALTAAAGSPWMGTGEAGVASQNQSAKESDEDMARFRAWLDGLTGGGA